MPRVYVKSVPQAIKYALQSISLQGVVSVMNLFRAPHIPAGNDVYAGARDVLDYYGPPLHRRTPQNFDCIRFWNRLKSNYSMWKR